jgi:archaellum biogenesis protein FlaJ (TadC family)
VEPDDAILEEAIAAGEEVLAPHDPATEASVRREMNAMFRRDRWMAIACVIALVIVLPFVYIALWNDMPGTATKVVLAASGVVLLVYNIASMVALVRNYARDRDFIYRRDVAHLRELKVARRASRGRA